MGLETGGAPGGSPKAGWSAGLDQLRPEDLIKKLSAAIQSGAAKEVTELAHEYVGASCQLRDDSDRAPLQELERLGRSGFFERS